VDRILLSRRAVADLRRVGPGPALDRLQEILRRLARDESNLDVKPLVGRAPWLRLRMGDWRVLYRPDAGKFLIARIVHRRELRRALRNLR